MDTTISYLKHNRKAEKWVLISLAQTKEFTCNIIFSSNDLRCTCLATFNHSLLAYNVNQLQLKIYKDLKVHR
jgi:hypothetical protein